METNKGDIVILKGRAGSGKTLKSKEWAKISLSEGKRVFILDYYGEYEDLLHDMEEKYSRGFGLTVLTQINKVLVLGYLNMIIEMASHKPKALKFYLIIEGLGQLVEQEEQQEFFRILDRLTALNVDVMLVMQDIDNEIEPTVLQRVLRKAEIIDLDKSEE